MAVNTLALKRDERGTTLERAARAGRRNPRIRANSKVVAPSRADVESTLSHVRRRRTGAAETYEITPPESRDGTMVRERCDLGQRCPAVRDRDS